MQKRQPLKFDTSIQKISANTEKLVRMFLVLNPKERASFAQAQDFLSSYFPYSKELQLKFNTQHIEIPQDVNLNIVVEKSKYNFENFEKEPRIQEITVPKQQLPLVREPLYTPPPKDQIQIRPLPQEPPRTEVKVNYFQPPNQLLPNAPSQFTGQTPQ